jgi:hypothetical protein
MKLRLFNQPYSDLATPGIDRLLFESVEPLVGSDGALCDFYLYVWIRDGKRLDRFQAVFDEDYVLTWAAHPGCTFGKICREPINRTIGNAASSGVREMLVALLANLQCERFAKLLEQIGLLAKGIEINPAELDREEERLLAQLCAGRT